MLPRDEVQFLSSLPKELMHARLAYLHASGWSLNQLAESLDPPRPKTTVHFWVRNAATDASVRRRPLPAPSISVTAAVPVRRAPRTRTISPKVPPDLRPILYELSLKARRYRAKTPFSSPIAQANRELTDLSLSLYEKGVPAAEIASAAGVSYRAMARRISNELASKTA